MRADHEETDGVAAAGGEGGDHVADRVRRAVDVSWAVVHGFDESIAATRSGRVLVSAVDVREEDKTRAPTTGSRREWRAVAPLAGTGKWP